MIESRTFSGEMMKFECEEPPHAICHGLLNG